MNRIKPYNPLIVTISVYIIVIAFLLVYFSNIVNSNFFIASITFLVGFLAFYLYIKQKQDYKSNAANIILTEIRNAERSLEKIKEMGPTDEIRKISILPTNNWLKYNHLFIKDFDRDEWDLIDDFYSKCELAEEAIKEIRNSFYVQIRTKLRFIQRTLGRFVLIAKDAEDYEKRKESFLSVFQKEGFLSRPGQYFKDISPIFDTPKITVSIIGNKLKKIAKIN